MRKSVKLTLTALTAALLLASAISTASARTLSSSSSTFRTTWSNLEFTNSFGFGTIRCEVTLEGTFHSRTIAKTINSLIGAITRAETRAPCTGGEAIPRRETLPWHAQYGGFEGTLPNITGITLTLSRLRFRIQASGCDAEYGDSNDIIRGTLEREAGGAVTRLTPNANDRVDAIRTNSFICPPRGGFRNTSSSVTALGSSTSITVTLI